MTRVLLPTVLREHADGNRSVDVGGSNVGEAIEELTQKHPALRAQLLDDEGGLRNYVNVFVGEVNIRDRENENTKVSENDEILIVPALAGG